MYGEIEILFNKKVLCCTVSLNLSPSSHPLFVRVLYKTKTRPSVFYSTRPPHVVFLKSQIVRTRASGPPVTTVAGRIVSFFNPQHIIIIHPIW